MSQPFPGPISSVEAQQKRRRLGARVNVFIDGRFSFALAADLAFKYGLKPDLVIDQKFLSQLLAEDGDMRALAAALNFIGYRPRASEEVRKRLERDEWPDEVIARVLAKLAEQKLLDDADFANLWVESRSRSKPRGARLLQQELRQKGVARDDIQAAMPDADEEVANAVAALEKQMRRWENLEERDQKQKAIAFLQRRGFGFGTARSAWEKTREE